MNTSIRAAFAALTFGALCGCAPSDRVTLYVAPTGNDANAGVAARPLRTLAGARNAVRRLKAAAQGKAPRTITVVFQDGVYPLSETVTFSDEDSATSGQTITYAAANRGAVIFDGGRALDWKPLDAHDPAAKLIPAHVQNRVKVASIPASQDLPPLSGGRKYSSPYPALLYANGKQAPIAAWPNASDDWSDLYRELADADYNQEILAQNRADAKTMRFICREKEHIAKWLKEPDLWVYGLWFTLWDDTHAQIRTADLATGVVTLDATNIPKGYTINWEGHRYRILNALSEMDRPGEWVIDRAHHRAYRMDDGTTPVMSATKDLIAAEGLTGVTFEGFAFCHARGDAMQLRDCHGVRVRGCTMRACGAWAVKVMGGSDCRVEGCDVCHTGEGGILLRGGERTTLTRCNHAAVNNHIHHWGERLPMYRAAIGLGRAGEGEGPTANYACGVTIEHNLIHHGRHQAIGFIGNLNDIRWNIIHDVCACSRDCGAIYGYTDNDWAMARGTRIEHNCIYKTGFPSPEGLFFVIYLDGFISGVTVRNNICIGGDVGLFHQGGHANVFEKNLVACCTRAARRSNLGGNGAGHTNANGPLWKNLQRDKALFQSERWATQFPELAAQSKMTDANLAQSTMAVVYRDNVFSASGSTVLQNDKRLAPYNTVTNNLVIEEDPGFVDFAHYNFNLRPDCAAYALVGDLGFDRMGLTNGPDRASAAVHLGADITPVPPLAMPGNPAARIGMFFWYYGAQKFTKEKPLATDMVNCEIPKWNLAGNIISGKPAKLAKDGKWITYELSFVPTFSGSLTIELAGNQVVRTCVDDFRVTGATIQNGGFEGTGGWSAPSTPDRLVDLRQFGIFASDRLNKAPEGQHFAIVNDDARMSQNITVEAGKRVTLQCRATAWRAP